MQASLVVHLLLPQFKKYFTLKIVISDPFSISLLKMWQTTGILPEARIPIARWGQNDILKLNSDNIYAQSEIQKDVHKNLNFQFFIYSREN